MGKEMSKEIQRIVERLGANAYRFSGKTVLLAGGAGFLGKHFVKVFQKLNNDVLDKPCSVISVDNYITGTKNLDESIVRDPNIMGISFNPRDLEARKRRCNAPGTESADGKFGFSLF